jgi:hypothetical protein
MAWKSKAARKAYNKQYQKKHAAEIAARKKAKYVPHPKVKVETATKRSVSALSPRPFEPTFGTCQSCKRENQALAYNFCIECRMLGAT